MKIRAVAIMALVGSVSISAAEYKVAAWRCGTGLIKAGDSDSKLRKRCGEADSVRSVARGIKAYTYWGSRGLTTVVTVNQGVVTTISQRR